MQRPCQLAIVSIFVAVTMWCPGCDGSTQDHGDDGGGDGSVVATDSGADAATDADLPDAAPPLLFAFTTTAFAEGASIPLRYECGGILQGPGENISPDLAWTEGPAGTLSYAIIMDDVDSGVVHWVIYDIPADVFALPENLPSGYVLTNPSGAKQAELQGSGYHGYFGPCSEFSTNTYRWTIHAMSTATVTGATQTTTEYEMVPLIQAGSLESASFTAES